ncbi:MAG: cysteine hydrolase [Spirochaetes bacterium]|nr:cysteine hydrolase [Spirochaetota bacterium]
MDDTFVRNDEKRLKGSWFTAPSGRAESYGFKLDPEKGVFGISKGEWFGKRSALLVIDMQNYSILPRWRFVEALFGEPEMRRRVYPDYYERLEKIVVPNIVTLIELFRTRSLKIVFVQYASELPGFEDMSPYHRYIWSEIERNTGIPYTPDSGSFEIIDEIRHRIRDEDIYLKKITNGAFASTRLDTILKNLGIRSLVVCGAWTNCCVETTVREAFDRGYLVNLVDDACIASGREFHEATLLNLGAFYCNVCTTEEAVGAMSLRTPGP